MLYNLLLLFYSLTKMPRADEHDVLMVKEMIASNTFKCKTESRERTSCWDVIPVTLNSIENPNFDQ